MNRRSFALTPLALALTMAGCASTPTLIDLAAYDGRELVVSDRTAYFLLPASQQGGELAIWSNGEQRWFPGSVSGNRGHVVIGRVDDDYGTPFIVRYVTPERTYIFRIRKVRKT